jgi:hypothetical protein
MDPRAVPDYLKMYEDAKASREARKMRNDPVMAVYNDLMSRVMKK